MLSLNPLETTKYARQIYDNVGQQVPELTFAKDLPATQKHLVVIVGKDSTPELLKNHLSNEAVSADLKDNKKIQLYGGNDSKVFERATVYVTDLDNQSSRDKIANFAVKLSDDLVAAKAKEATIHIDSSLKGVLSNEAIGIIASVIILRGHKFERKNQEEEKPQKAFDKLTIVSDFLDTEDKLFKFHTSVYKYTILAREFVSSRANIATTSFVSELATWIAETHPGVESTIIVGDDLVKQGLNLIHGVGKGSEHAPRLVSLSYRGKPDSQEVIGLVGKGIVFDAGGLNIKMQMMDLMYGDKGGAVAVLSAFLGIVDLKLPVNVSIALGVAENAVDSRSYRPSDIIRSLNGLTVMIGNTDAEGRLVLADSLTWLQRKYKPTKVIDVATLTGASMVALGGNTGALFSNNDEFAKEVERASEGSFEDIWRLPIKDEHREAIKSPVSDINNISGSPFGGACTAAAFLERFIEKDTKWCHLDIAGPGIGMGDFVGHRKGGTGFGTRLLLKYFYDLA